MFTQGQCVGWVTKSNTFIGWVLESGHNTSVVLVIATAKGNKYDGKEMAIFNGLLQEFNGLL